MTESELGYISRQTPSLLFAALIIKRVIGPLLAVTRISLKVRTVECLTVLLILKLPVLVSIFPVELLFSMIYSNIFLA